MSFVEHDNVDTANTLTLRNVWLIDVFLSPTKNVRSQQLDLANHLAVTPRLLLLRQKKHGFQTCCSEHVAQTVDDAWQIVDAGNWEL